MKCSLIPGSRISVPLLLKFPEPKIATTVPKSPQATAQTPCTSSTGPAASCTSAPAQSGCRALPITASLLNIFTSLPMCLQATARMLYIWLAGPAASCVSAPAQSGCKATCARCRPTSSACLLMRCPISSGPWPSWVSGALKVP